MPWGHWRSLNLVSEGSCSSSLYACPAAEVPHWWWPPLLLGSVKKKQSLVNVIPDRVTALFYLVSCAQIIPERNIQFNPFFLFLPGYLSGHLERNLKVPDLEFPLCFPLGRMHSCSVNWGKEKKQTYLARIQKIRKIPDTLKRHCRGIITPCITVQKPDSLHLSKVTILSSTSQSAQALGGGEMTHTVSYFLSTFVLYSPCFVKRRGRGKQEEHYWGQIFIPYSSKQSPGEEW